MLERNNIIGQKDLLDRIDNLIRNDDFPKFIILVGISGSGKKLISNYISDQLECTFVPSSIKIEDVREIISMSYTVLDRTCYMFADCDTMSISAKNALLKITEEPPTNSYFIMTLNNKEIMLNTILSRATIFDILPYSRNDLELYANHKKYEVSQKELIFGMCANPGELDKLMKMKDGVSSFISFTENVLDFIGQASIPNCLKLSAKFALKKDEDGYDVKQFLESVISICNLRYKQSFDLKYSNLCVETCKIVSELKLVSVNKLAVLDKWLLSAHSILGAENL